MNDTDLKHSAIHAEAINVEAAEHQQPAQQDRPVVVHIDANINEELPPVQGNGVPLTHPPLAAGQSCCSKGVDFCQAVLRVKAVDLCSYPLLTFLNSL